jgi:hypothetical protein
MEAIRFPRPGQESSPADMSESTKTAFYVLLPQVQALGNLLRACTQRHAADITERISQARRLFGSMNKQVLISIAALQI